MASYGEPDFDGLGFAIVLTSAAIGGQRWALTQVLMSRIGSKMNSIMTIYVISPASALTLIPFAFWLEGEDLFNSKFVKDPSLLTLAILNVIGAGFFAFAMIFVELALIERTSSMTLGVVGYLKQIIQIIISVIIFNDSLTPLNVTGMIVKI